MAKQEVVETNQAVPEVTEVPNNSASGSYTHKLTLPVKVYEQLTSISAKSGVSMDDLLIASAEIFFRKPTQSLMRRVLRKAQEYRVERILSAFPAPTKRVKNNGE